MFQKTEFTYGLAGQILHRNAGNRVGCCLAVEPDLIAASKLPGNVRADQKLSEPRKTRMSNWAVVENGAPLVRVANARHEPRAAEVVPDVAYCGVCHSDLHFWKGSYNISGGKTMKLSDRGVSLPRVPGHEVVGRVARLGPDARNIAVGDLRVVYPWLGCGHCAPCRGGQDNLCTQPQAVGVMHQTLAKTAKICTSHFHGWGHS